MPPKQPVILTRYLYPQSAVKISLRHCILQGLLDEALFWAYELYDSGFYNETRETIISIYDENIAKLDLLTHQIRDRMEVLHEITTILSRDFVGLFVKSLVSLLTSITNVILSPVDTAILDALKTVEIPERCGYKYLREQCKYSVSHDTTTSDNLLDIYRNNWIFHASYSPIWEKRIKEFGGKIERRKKTVLFSEDAEEEFYNKYGVEPDEQPLEIQHRWMGIKC